MTNLEQFVLFVLTFNDSYRSVSDLRRLYAEAANASVRTDEVSRTCQNLVCKKAIRVAHKYANAQYNSYASGGTFDYEGLKDLLRTSVAGHWWKIFEVDDVTGVPNARQLGYFRNGGQTLADGQKMALMLRALIDDTGLRVDLMDFYDPVDYYRQAALSLVELIDPSCAWPWTFRPFSKSNPLVLHLTLMSLLFVRGADLRAMVTGLAHAVSSGTVRLTEELLCEFVAKCVLLGVPFDAAAVQKWEIAPEAKNFADIDRLLRAGDLAAANKLYAPAVRLTSRLNSVAAPAFNILAVLVNAFEKPSNARILQCVRAICPNKNYRRYYRPMGENNLIVEHSARLEFFASIQEGCLSADKLVEKNAFVDNLAWAVWSLAWGIRKEESQRVAEMIFQSAERALERGYATVAAALVGTFGWALPSEKRNGLPEIARRINAAGGIWFRPMDEAPSEWKRVVAALDEHLPKAVTARSHETAKVRTGRIVWALSIGSSNYDVDDAGRPLNGNYICDRITPCFRGPRAAEDGSDDKAVTLKSVYGGKYDACLTDRDRAVIAALNKVGYIGPRGTASVPAAALEALCGLDNVVLHLGDAPDAKFKFQALELVRQDVPVVSTTDKSGAVSLAAPSWCLNVSHAYILRLPPNTSASHVSAASSPPTSGSDRWLYYPIARDVRAVLDVFRDFGEDGVLTLPKEALATARPILGRLASVLPLQGTLGDVVGAGGMARLEGDATPLVRLALDNDLHLHVSRRVRPVPAATDLLFEPGVGQSERTVRLAKGPTLLVRNLAQEKCGAEKVDKTLATYDSWRDGSGEWQIDEPVEALGALAAVQALGKSVHVEWLPGKRLSVSHPAARPSVEASLGADRWFAVSGDWKLDDGRLASFTKILENLDRRVGFFVPIDEKGYLALNRALLRQLEALRTAGQVRKDKLAVSPAALPMLDGAFAGDDEGIKMPRTMTVAAERIREVFATTPETPRSFKGTMRPYQEEGYRWLSRLYDCGIGACLADDMGLGKTIQLIALLAATREHGVSLVIAPASVAFNWRNEFARFAPSLRVALVGQVAGADDEDVAGLAAKHDVVVTSYGVAASRLAAFSSVTWNVVILDEAQAIKNHLTQRAKSVKELQARFRVAATGTPVENRLTELWSIFDFLNPGMLGGETHFLKELAPHGEATPQLKRLVKPLILRRIKREVLTDLPEKEEITVPVVLGDEERTAYEAMRTRALAKLEQEDLSNKIAILAELTRLRRFCCHPSLVMPSVASAAKLEALERLLTGLRENGHRALVFSQFVDFLAIVRTLLERNGWTYGYLDGSTSKGDREKAVERFQAGEGDFFLISLKAGGMGLNLTSANYVILLDPWWNPAVENQAADRVHRIGQRLPVTVYRLIAQDTIEEKVVNLHAKKTALAEDILASGAASLSAEAMLGLLSGD